MELYWRIIDGAGNPITGAAASTSLKCRRSSDGKLLDWADGSFKSSGWTTLVSTLAEADAANLSGVYIKAVTTTGWIDGEYHFFAEYTGSPKQYAVADVCLKNGIEFEAYMSATTPVSVLPFSGSVQASYAREGLTIEVIQGDSVSIPYDMATDLTGYTVWFGAKASLSDTTYAIAVKEITASVTDIINGRGLIPFTAIETDITPTAYLAEIEIRKAGQVVTAIKFKLKIKGQVIK